MYDQLTDFAKNNPITTLAALGTVGLFGGLIYKRRKEEHQKNTTKITQKEIKSPNGKVENVIDIKSKDLEYNVDLISGEKGVRNSIKHSEGRDEDQKNVSETVVGFYGVKN